jgi:pilus assembly protein CpaD
MTRDQETSAMTRPLRTTGVACRLAATGFLAATLAGCYTARDTSNDVPFDYRQRHPITLQERDRTVNIFVGSNRGDLTPAQRADVLAFAHVWKREATGGVFIDVPSGTAHARAAADVLHEIESILAAAGVPPNGMVVRPYQPANPTKLATIRLSYPRIAAEAGPCGLWPNDLGLSQWAVQKENQPYWNLGCASQRNLAAMVDNPADLAQPRGETQVYTARRTVVLDHYRKGESTGTNYPNADKGKISDVGR